MGCNNSQMCVACTRNCRLFHTTTTTTAPTSFIKVIVHQNDFKILYIPPMLNRTVSAWVNKKIKLEDSSGKRWVVTISDVDGSFAFEEGWDIFSLEHGLQIGDFLVFNCINKLDFDVKIFGETACERLDFSKKRNLKKRSRSLSPVRGTKLVRQDPNALLVSKPDMPKVERQHMEVDLGGAQNSIGNISKYDYENGSTQFMCASEHNEDTCYTTTSTYRDPMLEEVLLSTGKASYTSELEISERNNSLCEADRIAHDKTSTLKLEEIIEHKSIMSNSSREVQKCRFPEGFISDQAPISKETHALHIGGYDNANQMFDGISNLSGSQIHNGEMKKVLVDTSPSLCSFNDKLSATGLPKVIEGDFDHSSLTFNQDDGSHFGTEDKFSCVVLTNNDPCLKLPKSLALSRRRGGCDEGGQRKRMVVLLRDPLRRLWPVLYYQDKPRLNLLTDGWLDFQIANTIQQEDVCVFQVEDKFQGIVAVQIGHK